MIPNQPSLGLQFLSVISFVRKENRKHSQERLGGPLASPSSFTKSCLFCSPADSADSGAMVSREFCVGWDRMGNKLQKPSLNDRTKRGEKGGAGGLRGRIQNTFHNQRKGGMSRQESLGNNWMPGLKC